MSLRVWLPLDGDLRNQGLSTVTVSSGTATYGAGKIGAKGLDLINSTQINLSCDKLANVTTFSICCWIKGLKDTSDSDWVSPIRFGVKKSDTAENYDFRFGKHDNASGTEGYPIGVYHNSYNTISSTNNTFTTAEDWGKWVHVCFIYDGTNIKGYKNGIQVFSHASGQGGYLTGNFRLRVGRCNWLINDLRIYDNCLSAAEVREIAQGLVLHYKLDEGNENLLLDTPKSHSPTAYNAYQFDMKENLVAGQTYTIQLWDVTVEHSAKTAAQMNLCVYWGGGSVRLYNFNGASVFTTLTDHYAYSPYLCATITPTEANASGSGATNAWLNIYNSVSNADGTRNMKIGAWKLEEGAAATQWVSSDADMTKIQDSSGYNHNGTVSDNIVISANTPRYSSSTQFNGSDTYIACGRGSMVRDAITVNIWAYMDTWVNTPGRIASCTQGGGWNFEDSSGRIVFQCGTGDTTNTWSGVVSPTTITYGGLASGWHMFTGTYDGLSSKLYIDGEFINANNKYTTHTPIFYHSSNGIFLGAEAATNQTAPTTPYFNGLLSDFRIYCTPLLDTDIKQLYNVGMKIDKIGNMHPFELEENIGMVSNVKFVNNSANSVTYDATTDTYTIVSKADTSSWGYGVRLADDPPLWVPYGATYRWTAEVWTPIALSINTDYNNTTGSADTNWSGNDNDATGTRLAAGVSIPANTWTRIYRGASNTNNGNTNHLPIRDYSSLGLVTNGQSNPVTWKVRHLQWYLIDNTFNPQLKRTGVFKSPHFTEAEEDLNKPAQLNKKMFSTNATQFIER